MNIVILEGRLTKDPERAITTTGKSVSKFTLAVDREVASKDGQKEADFIQVQCYDKVADFVNQWLKKGTLIQLEGRINTGSYDKDGVKVYFTNVIALKVKFAPTNEREKTETKQEEPKINMDELLPF